MAMKNSLAMRLYLNKPSLWQLEEYADNIEAGLLSFKKSESENKTFRLLPENAEYDPLCAILMNAAIVAEEQQKDVNLKLQTAKQVDRAAERLLKNGAKLFGVAHPGGGNQSFALELAVRGGCIGAVMAMQELAECPKLSDAGSMMVSDGHLNPWESRRKKEAKKTPLLVHVAKMNNIAGVRMLLEAGANPLACDSNGVTGPAVTSDPEILDLFAERGFDPLTADHNGATPYMVMGGRSDLNAGEIGELRKRWAKLFGKVMAKPASRYASLAEGLASKTKGTLLQEMRMLSWIPGELEDNKSLVQALALSMAKTPVSEQKTSAASFELILKGADMSHVGPLGVSDGALFGVACSVQEGYNSFHSSVRMEAGTYLFSAAKKEGGIKQLLDEIQKAWTALKLKFDKNDNNNPSIAMARALVKFAEDGSRKFSFHEWAEAVNSDALKSMKGRFPAATRGNGFGHIIEKTLDALEQRLPEVLGEEDGEAAAELFHFALAAMGSAEDHNYSSETVIGANGLPTKMLVNTHLTNNGGAIDKQERRPGAAILDKLWDLGVRPLLNKNGMHAIALLKERWPAVGAMLTEAMMDQRVAAASVVRRNRI
jgi:hypothetical protein